MDSFPTFTLLINPTLMHIVSSINQSIRGWRNAVVTLIRLAGLIWIDLKKTKKQKKPPKKKNGKLLEPGSVTFTYFSPKEHQQEEKSVT